MLTITININPELIKQLSKVQDDNSEIKKEIRLDLDVDKSNISEVKYLYYPRVEYSEDEFREIYWID